MLVLPSGDDYVGLAIDEIMASAAAIATVGARIDRLLRDLATGAPPARRPVLEERRRALAAWTAK